MVKQDGPNIVEELYDGIYPISCSLSAGSDQTQTTHQSSPSGSSSSQECKYLRCYGDANIEIHIQSVREIADDGLPTGEITQSMWKDVHCYQEAGVSLMTILHHNESVSVNSNTDVATGDMTTLLADLGNGKRIQFEVIEVRYKGTAGTINVDQMTAQKWNVIPGDVKFNVLLLDWKCFETTEIVDIDLHIGGGNWIFFQEDDMERVYKTTIQGNVLSLILPASYFVRDHNSCEWKQHSMPSGYPLLRRESNHHIITLRLVKFSGDVFYDPVVRKEAKVGFLGWLWNRKEEKVMRENGLVNDVSRKIEVTKGESFQYSCEQRTSNHHGETRVSETITKTLTSISPSSHLKFSKEKERVTSNGEVTKEVEKTCLSLFSFEWFNQICCDYTSESGDSITHVSIEVQPIINEDTLPTISEEPTWLSQSASSLFEEQRTDAFTTETVSEDNTASFEFDAFLSHAWGVDEEGRDNHHRVLEMKEALEQRGLRVWFDESNLRREDIRNSMAAGIDTSKKVIIFVTLKYIKKVAGEMNGSNDNCKHEFEYAYNRKCAENMIPVVMEEACLRQDTWAGQLGMVLGSQFYFNYLSGAELEDCAMDIARAIE